MAVYEPSRALSEGVRVNPSKLISRVAGAVMDWNDRRVTRNALNALTEHELDDIGLCRGDIHNF